MKLRTWNGSALVDIQPPDLKDYCRAGIYICCKEGDGHSHNAAPPDCGYHLWLYVGPDPIPHHNILLMRIRAEVPHINGQGAHMD